MRRGKLGALGMALLALLGMLPMTACEKGPKRRGPQNYTEYRAAHDPRYRAPAGAEAGSQLSSDDGAFGPANEAIVLAADSIRSGGVADAGVVAGRISYGGKEAKPKKLDISKDAWCADGHEVFTEDVVVSANGGLKNVLVYVSRGFNRFEFTPPTTPAQLDQNGCKYVPHVLAMMAGQDLSITNSDGTSHNFHFTGAKNEVPNTTQRAGQKNLVSDLTQVELAAVFRCDIHPWMVAPVHILAHPYFTVSDDDGNFELKGLPAGTYEISFLHERSDMVTAPQTVTIEAGKTANLTAQFTR